MNSDLLAPGFLRHVTSCQSAVLPGTRTPFRIGVEQVGWVDRSAVERLASFPQIGRNVGGVTLSDPAALPHLAKTLASEGFYRFRNEQFDVRAHPDGPAIAQIDRGAVPWFGVMAIGVHVNGLVKRRSGLHVWIARRAPDKLLDPNKLDHIVAGGVPAGLSPADTLIKEAAEEAAIPADLARQAQPVATIAYATERAEGLRRDFLHCYDLMLPEAFEPRAVDGEVAGFELWPIERAAETIARTDDFKFNVNMVMIDLFIRHRLVTGDGAAMLRRALAMGSIHGSVARAGETSPTAG